MAVVRPFQALRYNEIRLPELSAVLAPPYDIISPAEQRALYDRHPENIIRLEYGVQSAGDTAEDNRYTRARATLAAWRGAQVLLQEEAPSFYPHGQRFTWDGQSIPAGAALPPCAWSPSMKAMSSRMSGRSKGPKSIACSSCTPARPASARSSASLTAPAAT